MLILQQLQVLKQYKKILFSESISCMPCAIDAMEVVHSAYVQGQTISLLSSVEYFSHLRLVQVTTKAEATVCY